MTDSTPQEQLAVIEFNGSPARVVAGTYPEPEFRRLLIRANLRVGQEDAIGIRTRPDEPVIGVLATDSTVTVHDGPRGVGRSS